MKESVKVRILLADTQDIVRAGLRSLLQVQWGWEVCGDADNGLDAVRLAEELDPDIVILDVDLNKLDGVKATNRIKVQRPGRHVLIFSDTDDEYEIRQVLAGGASGFVPKSAGGATLIAAIKSILDHEMFFAPCAAETLLNSFLNKKDEERSGLTTRQLEIVRLVALGKSNKEISSALAISIKTVETHRAAIMRKMGFRSVASLVRYAVRERVIRA